MEQLISDIKDYAERRGIKPATVLQMAAGYGGTVWAKWVAKTASCSLDQADRIRAFMRDNPVPSPQDKDAA